MIGHEWRTTSWTKCCHSSTRSYLSAYPNTPASFQGYANKPTAEKLDVFVGIIYLYVILIYTKGPGQRHLEAVRVVLIRTKFDL